MKLKISLLAALVLVSTPAFSKQYYFFGYHVSAPPAAGSEDYQRDFIKLHEYQDHRTAEECAVARAQGVMSLRNFFGPETGVLTEKELKQAAFLSKRVMKRTAFVVNHFKSKFHRARPYVTDPTITPCVSKPGDLSYPSLHTANGYALALALSRKFPAKKDLIMKQGYQIGENRILGGVHHPSDVEAGRKVAAQIVKWMIITRARH